MGTSIGVSRSDAALVGRGREDNFVYFPLIPGYARGMKVQEIQDFVERQPFRPFAVRLSNDARYDFNSPRDIGADKNYQFLLYFADSGGFILIDTDSIVEVFQGG